MKQHLSSVSLYSVRQLSIYTAAGSQSVTDYWTNKSARFLFSQHISRSQIFKVWKMAEAAAPVVAAPKVIMNWNL